MSNGLTKREETQPEAVSQERWLKPACDVYEDEQEWLIVADVPGVAKDALSVHLDKNDLTSEQTIAEDIPAGVSVWVLGQQVRYRDLFGRFTRRQLTSGQQSQRRERKYGPSTVL